MRPLPRHVALWIVLLSCARGSGVAAQEISVAAAPADTGAVRAWIRENAVALRTVEPGRGFADLEPFRDIVGDARVVALGEGTHGTREFYRLKHRLIEFLVREMDFNVFAIEATLPEALDLNRYVLTGEGDPARALAGMYFWIYDTEEVLDLVRWMRAYNASETSGRKVKFYGFDMQFSARAARTVLDYLRRVDAAAAEAADTILAPLADPFVAAEIPLRWSDERTGRLAASVSRLADQFDARIDTYVERTSAEEADLVRRHLEILLQFLRHEGRERDPSMADNVAWILDREGPDSKAILWAHNFHVGGSEGTQGEVLRTMLGDELRVFGFFFGRGGFQARDVGTDGAIRPWVVPDAPDSTLAGVLTGAAPEIALLDLGALPESGPGFTHQHPEWFWWRAPVAPVFDALLFVEETVPARSNLTGRLTGMGAPTYPANLDFETGQPGTWPLGWTGPRGIARIDWDVRLNTADAQEGVQAVLIRRLSGPRYGETAAQLSQRADASPWRGQRIALNVWARIDGGPMSRGHLWLEITRPGDRYSEPVFYGSTADRPITSPDWQVYRILADVPIDADIISFGFAFSGDGEAWVDSFSIGPTFGTDTQ
jgi:erythromycin esterase